MKAYEIKWNIDIKESYEKLDEMTAEAAASALEIPVNTYGNMTTEERHDYAYDKFHHCPAALEEFLGMPDEVEIPEEIASDPEYSDNYDGLVECISDWLSDEYGYCHEGFKLDIDPSK